MEIVARRLAAALPGERIESVLTPGLNALKTFDPPLSALDGAAFTDVRRRGKLLLLEADTASHGPLTLLTHLMSAGRLMLYDKRGSLRDKTSRVLIRISDPVDPRELRLREFGTKQAAWVKLLTLDGLEAEPSLKTLGPEAWPDPPDLAERLAFPRPLHSLLRDQQVIAGIGRTWVDEILHAAQALAVQARRRSLRRARPRRCARRWSSELGRVIAAYEEKVALPLPEKFPKPTRVHAHQGEPCPRCETVLEAVFYEDYVMTYCPHCQTEGRILKDRRLSRLLK